MKGFLIICLLSLLSTAVYVSMPEAKGIPDSGICVVEFNASFNAGNSVDWLDKLSDCKGKRIDILANPELQKEHKIVVVPTIIVFWDGEEVKRFQDVQEAVDEILMDSF